MALFVSKWASLATGFLLELVSGFQYGFSVYSQAMKETHHFSQQQVAMIGTVINASNCLFSVLAGSTFDALSRYPRMGPRVTCGIAMLLASLGYPLVWAMASGRLPVGQSQWSVARAISVAAFFASLSGPFCDTTSISVGVRNFPRHRGQVVGQLKSFVGIAASLLVLLFSALPGAQPIDFLLLQAGIGSLVTAAGIAFQNAVPFRQHDEVADPASVDRKLRVTLFGSSGIACAIAAISVLGPGLSQAWHSAAAGGVLWGLLALVLWTALSSGPVMVRQDSLALQRPLLWSSPEEGGGTATGIAAAPGIADEGAPDIPGTASTVQEQQAPRLVSHLRTEDGGGGGGSGEGSAIAKAEQAILEAEPEMSLLEVWASPEYWLLYAIVTVGTGTGLTIVNNLGQMVVSLGGANGSQVVFVALFSVTSCFARNLLGEISQRALMSRGTPRPAFLTLACAIMTAACAACCFGSDSLLYAVAALGGFSYGSFWVLTPSILSEMYGLRYFATIYTATTSAPAVGGFLLSNILTASLYDQAASRDGDNSSGCIGPSCFRLSFLILSALNLFSAAASLVVLNRIRPRYRAIHSWLLLHQHTPNTC